MTSVMHSDIYTHFGAYFHSKNVMLYNKVKVNINGTDQINQQLALSEDTPVNVEIEGVQK